MAKLQSSADYPEEAEQKQQEKARSLKKWHHGSQCETAGRISNFVEKAIELVPHNTDDECTSQKSAQAEEVEKGGEPPAAEGSYEVDATGSESENGQEGEKFQWCRIYGYQEKRYDKLEEMAQSQGKDAVASEPQLQLKKDQQGSEGDAAKNQRDKEVLWFLKNSNSKKKRK